MTNLIFCLIHFEEDIGAKNMGGLGLGKEGGSGVEEGGGKGV